jgi:hypothetical protein
MAFGDNMMALEARMLTRFGAFGTLVPKGTAYDADLDRMVEVAGQPRNVRMTLGPSETLDEEGREVFRTVAKMQVEPVRGDEIVFAGKPYTVGNVQTLYEGDTAVLYVAEVD